MKNDETRKRKRNIKQKHRLYQNVLFIVPLYPPKALQPSPGLSPPTPDPHTHPRRSIPILCHPDQFQYPHFHLKPFIPIPIRFHTSNDPHTHQSLQYPSQILHTHLKPLTPIAGPPHPTKALTCISGLPYLILSLHTIPWSFTPNLGPPTQSQVAKI